MRKESYELVIDSRKGVQTFDRVSKSTARKAYNDGKKIVVSMINYRLDSPWQPFAVIAKNTTDFLNFDGKINSYEYYNSNNEVGLYCKFFIEKEV